MNISLSGAGSKKKGGSSLAFGLNSRSKKPASSSGGNVFGDDGDSSDNDSDGDNRGLSSREVVNKQIAREQAAARRRAQAALAKETANVFDYDGAYDSFQPKETAPKEEPKNQERKSKYIGDLLKAAKVRERERDAIYERRNAKEQAIEDANADYRGKEKFVTKSYKRKLQERQQWEAEQERKEREEEANDVTKKKAGSAFAGFYGNLNKSAMTEQKSDDPPPSPTVEKQEETNEAMALDDDFDPRQGFLGGFERSSQAEESNSQLEGNTSSSSQPVQDETAAKLPKLSMREKRERKVAEARERYLQRKQAIQADQ